MFKKIIGIVGTIAVVVVVVMVALSSRTPGFFPDKFEFLRGCGFGGETALTDQTDWTSTSPEASTANNLPCRDSFDETLDEAFDKRSGEIPIVDSVAIVEPRKDSAETQPNAYL